MNHYQRLVFVVYSNVVGKQWGDVSFFGGSMAINPFGKFIAKAPIDEEALTIADLEAKEILDARIKYQGLRDRRPNIYEEILEYPK